MKIWSKKLASFQKAWIGVALLALLLTLTQAPAIGQTTSLPATQTVFATSPDSTAIEAKCPANMVATGGGVVGASKASSNSAPASNDAAVAPITSGEPTAWYGSDPTGISTNSSPLVVYVVCVASSALHTSVVEHDVADQAAPLEADCAGSNKATGGGAIGGLDGVVGAPAISGSPVRPIDEEPGFGTTVTQPNAWYGADASGKFDAANPFKVFVVCGDVTTTAIMATSDATSDPVEANCPVANIATGGSAIGKSGTANSAPARKGSPVQPIDVDNGHPTQPNAWWAEDVAAVIGNIGPLRAYVVCVPQSTTTTTTVGSTTTTAGATTTTTVGSTTTTAGATTTTAGGTTTTTGLTTTTAGGTTTTTGGSTTTTAGGTTTTLSSDTNCDGHKPTIVGTPGNDILIGTSHQDVISGLGGNDIIKGRGGDDIICGGSGDDIIAGGSGNDRMFGEAGDDKLAGQGGKDLADGGDGFDICSAKSTFNCEVPPSVGNRATTTTRVPLTSSAGDGNGGGGEGGGFPGFLQRLFDLLTALRNRFS